MFKRFKTARTVALAFAVFLLGFMPVSATQARDTSIRLVIYKAGYIVGIRGGEGMMYYKGKRYKLSVGGVSLGATIGASRAELIGQVRNLRRAGDIVGTYTAVGGSAVIAGGVSAVELENSKGVRLSLSGRSIGLELSLDLAGMQIDLR
jgi:hypothetical protein